MELRHLRYFIAAAREEHFGRAARKLAVAQPALSRRIADLETELGTQLFDRLPRGVRLSKAGMRFLEEIAPALESIEQAVKHAKVTGPSSAGQVRLGFSEIASHLGIIPEALKAFRNSHPDVSLELLTIGSLAQLRALQEKTIDAAIVYDMHLDSKSQRSFHSHTLHRGTIMVAMPRSHSLARRKTLLAKDLRDEPMLWPRRESAPRLYERLVEACRSVRLEPAIFQETATWSSLLSLVSAGMGLGFVGSETAGALPAGVTLKPVADLPVELQVELLWRKGEGLPAAKAFVEFLADHCQAAARNEIRA